MASGHVNRIKRPNTWLHRPMLQNVKKALANPEPSTHGTFETCPPILRMSADRGRPEVAVVTTLNRWTIKAAFARRLQSFAGGLVLRWV
jgi:hypothetical protein